MTYQNVSRLLSVEVGRFASSPRKTACVEYRPGCFRRRLSLATVIAGVYEYYGCALTAHVPDEPGMAPGTGVPTSENQAV